MTYILTLLTLIYQWYKFAILQIKHILFHVINLIEYSITKKNYYIIILKNAYLIIKFKKQIFKNSFKLVLIKFVNVLILIDELMLNQIIINNYIVNNNIVLKVIILIIIELIIIKIVTSREITIYENDYICYQLKKIID